MIHICVVCSGGSDEKCLHNCVNPSLVRCIRRAHVQKDLFVFVPGRGGSGEVVQCGAGYFTALMIKSKRDALKYSTGSSIDAQLVDRGRGNFLYVAIPNMDGLVVFHTLPFASLAPFPLKLESFYALLSRHAVVDYFESAALVALTLSALGVLSFVMPGDASSELLNTTSLTGAQAPNRFSVFVPVEFHHKVMASVETMFGKDTHAVFRQGLLQVGYIPYESGASSLEYRVFCRSCVYTSIVFYASDADWVLPLSLWRPCRIPLSSVFPTVAHDTGSLIVQVARGMRQDGEHSNTAYMDYPDDSAAMPAFSGEGICRKQVLLLHEVSLVDQQLWFPSLKPEFDISDKVNVEMTAMDLRLVNKGFCSPPGKGLISGFLFLIDVIENVGFGASPT